MATNLFDPSTVYNLLQQRGFVPNLVNRLPFGSAGEGLFQPSTNVIVAADPSKATSDLAKQLNTDSLSHEMVHSLQLNMFQPVYARLQDKVRNQQSLSTPEKQFMDAWFKLFVDSEDRKKMLDRLYKKGATTAEYDAYRTDPEELQAWGVGYMSRPTNKYTTEKSHINPHLNPSMASEVSVLMELYSKLPEDIKKLTDIKRKEEITQGRKKDTLGIYKESSGIFSDPFKPSIR